MQTSRACQSSLVQMRGSLIFSCSGRRRTSSSELTLLPGRLGSGEETSLPCPGIGDQAREEGGKLCCSQGSRQCAGLEFAAWKDEGWRWGVGVRSSSMGGIRLASQAHDFPGKVLPQLKVTRLNSAVWEQEMWLRWCDFWVIVT